MNPVPAPQPDPAANPAAAPVIAGLGFPCPSCGAPMAYQPLRAALACGACGHLRTLPEPTADEAAEARREQDYLEALKRLADRVPREVASVVECPACGAVTRFDAHVRADRCAFCASPLRREPTRVEEHLPVQAVLPFQLDAAAAQAVFARWIASRWFAPNALKHTVRAADGVRGAYLPWWTFDAATWTTYRGERGIRRQEDGGQRSDGSRDTRTVVDWTSVQGVVAVPFDDLLVVGSPSIPPHLARVLDHWQMQGLRPPAEEWLAGFTVEIDRRGLEPAFAEARQQMDGPIEQAIRRDIGGDEQRVHARQTAVEDIRFKHLLMPVWIGAYRFRGRPYQVVVNGQTGEVEGDRPWSAWKIGFAVLAVVVLILLAQWLQG